MTDSQTLANLLTGKAKPTKEESDNICEFLVRINKQAPGTPGGGHVGKQELDVGAGYQGIMFDYVSDETDDDMPLTHAMATRLGKTQVTISYVQRADGSVEPQSVHTVVISTQHADP